MQEYYMLSHSVSVKVHYYCLFNTDETMAVPEVILWMWFCNKNCFSKTSLYAYCIAIDFNFLQPLPFYSKTTCT